MSFCYLQSHKLVPFRQRWTAWMCRASLCQQRLCPSSMSGTKSPLIYPAGVNTAPACNISALLHRVTVTPDGSSGLQIPAALPALSQEVGKGFSASQIFRGHFPSVQSFAEARSASIWAVKISLHQVSIFCSCLVCQNDTQTPT